MNGRRATTTHLAANSKLFQKSSRVTCKLRQNWNARKDWRNWGALREKAEAQLREFKESEERAKRERPPDFPATPEEILVLDTSEKVSRARAAFETGRVRSQVVVKEWAFFRVSKASGAGGFLCAPKAGNIGPKKHMHERAMKFCSCPLTRFLYFCSEPLNNCSVGFFNLESKNFDWREYFERLVEGMLSESKPGGLRDVRTQTGAGLGGGASAENLS